MSHKHWSNIFDAAAQGSISVVYIGIGSAMGSYVELNSSNNQQSPCFLKKIPGRKVIILIDPVLEMPLRTEEWYQNIGNPLVLVDSETKGDKIYFREYQYDSVTIFAINDMFNFSHDNYNHDEESERYNRQVDENISKIINLIEICLGKQRKTKLILQNYTGASTVNFYNSLLSIFDKEDLLSNVIFDVTGQDPGCFWEITDEYPILNDDGNFIQMNYLSLRMMKGTPHFKQNLVKRVNCLVYPVTSNFIILSKDPSFELAEMDKLVNMFSIYSVEFNDFNKYREYVLSKLMELIRIMLDDILSSSGSNLSIDFFLELMFNRNEFINTMAKLKN
jgi:hypothetical protein